MSSKTRRDGKQAKKQRGGSTSSRSARPRSTSSRGRRHHGAGGRSKGIAAGITAAVAAFVVYGLWSYQNSSNPTSSAASAAGGARSYGYVESGPSAAPISELMEAGDGKRATVEGKVVDMGPTMGCWLIVDDGTRRIMVQTDPMIYIDQDVKGKTITATGITATVNGGMGYSGEQFALLTTGVSVLES